MTESEKILVSKILEKVRNNEYEVYDVKGNPSLVTKDLTVEIKLNNPNHKIHVHASSYGSVVSINSEIKGTVKIYTPTVTDEIIERAIS